VITIVPTRPEHAAELEELQRICFPTLASSQRIRSDHYVSHVERFPDGQWVALDGDRAVGSTTSIRYAFDPAHPDHTFDEIFTGGWLEAHDPDGAWLYGIDVQVHPDHRGRGIGRALYAARHDVVNRLGLSGQVTVGMLSGYEAHAGAMNVAEYYAEVAAGRLVDPTVSIQVRVGFEIAGLVEDYLDDPSCGNAGALLLLPVERSIG
jgi:GNAT superfamily N-acetyltransferase